MMHEHGFWGMGWMWILWLLLIVGVIWLVAALSRRSAPPRQDGESPEQTLKQRYARGEISRQEYEQKLADLRRG